MKKKLLIGMGILILIVGLPFAYWTISPFFRIQELNESIPQKEVVTQGPFTVVPTTGHPAHGTLRVIKTSDDTILRYENFETLNGPDLKLYLATDLQATEFIDLGDLKATKGNINYTVPEGTDLNKYKYVLTWCRTFSVLFNSVEIK